MQNCTSWLLIKHKIYLFILTHPFHWDVFGVMGGNPHKEDKACEAPHTVTQAQDGNQDPSEEAVAELHYCITTHLIFSLWAYFLGGIASCKSALPWVQLVFYTCLSACKHECEENQRSQNLCKSGKNFRLALTYIQKHLHTDWGPFCVKNILYCVRHQMLSDILK